MGKQKHSFSSAYRTLSFQHTYTISVKGMKPPLLSPCLPHLLLSLYPSPPPPLPLPLPSLATPPLHLLLSLYPSLSPYNPLSVRQRTPHHFCQSQLEAPVSSNHQEPGRLQEGERGGVEKGVKFAAIVCSFYHNSIFQLLHILLYPHPYSQVHTQLVLHSATLQGEGRWAGLGDAIDQVREWRDVCTVNSGLFAKL